MKIKILLSILVIATTLLSCKTKKAGIESNAMNNAINTEVNKPIDMASLINDRELGYRNADLFDEDALSLPVISYDAGAPGTVGNWERSFENAPPMIPHTMVGFVPIKAGANMCLACHLPIVAAALKATAMPQSHFTDYRPQIIEQEGLYKVDAEEGEVVSRDLEPNYNFERYNCTQCHVPQSNATVFIENQFNPFFRKEDGAMKTNLYDNIAEGVK